MNKKVVTPNKKVLVISIVVVVVIALCVLAAIYAPSMLEAFPRLHRIPQH